MFVTGQWAKVMAILQAREEQAGQAYQHEKNKTRVKELKKEAESKEKRMKDKARTIDKLTEEIMQKSNSLLQLHSP